ncbi:MAG: aminotransferase class V-fold PLP-dependent enzyme [Balneolaceae bacterium]|nr:MAG: aminotransferase class V-fold PLP-dependent enzyme [Balneolaceae bacterium]
MEEFDKLAQHLQPFYSRFQVDKRLLFTGHSHQAWPDAAFSGMDEYAEMTVRQIDKKWAYAFEKTEKLRNYLRTFYDDPGGLYCREQNTHVLLVSWLSSLNLREKPKIITTTGEFHSMYRQLKRLEEEGLEIVYLPHEDDRKLLDLMRDEIDDRTAAVMLSRIYFMTSEVNTLLPEAAKLTHEAGVPLMVDDYHGTNVIPLSLRDEGMEHVYLLIGGYKYLQWGESNCFLRFPKDCPLRPAVTGWFSAFGQLDKPRSTEIVEFDEGDQKFATGTYDPVSQYRAAAVCDFFMQEGLTPSVLQQQYRTQVGYLRVLFDGNNHDGSGIEHANHREMDQTGGFMALRSRHARELRASLLKEGIFTDARDQIIRIGPAPYTTSQQCQEVILALFNHLDALQKTEKVPL